MLKMRPNLCFLAAQGWQQKNDPDQILLLRVDRESTLTCPIWPWSMKVGTHSPSPIRVKFRNFLTFMQFLWARGSSKCGQNRSFSPPQGDTINQCRWSSACKHTLWVYVCKANFALISAAVWYWIPQMSKFGQLVRTVYSSAVFRMSSGRPAGHPQHDSISRGIWVRKGRPIAYRGSILFPSPLWGICL